MQGPDPDTIHPMPGFPQVCFLKNIITRPNIEVGNYTYYDDPDGASATGWSSASFAPSRAA